MSKPTLPVEYESLPAEADVALLEALAPVDLPGRRRAAMRRRILARVRAAAQLTTIHAHEGDWKPFLPKVSIKVLRKTGDTQTYLLKLAAGAVLLPHEHPMDEECMVLDGEVRIGDIFARAGDYHLAPQGRAHDPIVSESGALLFLRGAVPSASHVKWSRIGEFVAAGFEPLRGFTKK